MKLTFETFNQKVNCPHKDCKGQNILDEIVLKEEVERTCIHCQGSFYVKSKASVKHKLTRKKGGTKNHKSDHKKTIERLDKLWSRVIIAKAGFKSEFSLMGGQGIILQAHHIGRKKSLFMRYHLENGVCLTRNEHFKAPYSPGEHDVKRFNETLKKVKGDGILDRIEMLKRCNTKVDLFLVEKMLLQEISKYE